MMECQDCGRKISASEAMDHTDENGAQYCEVCWEAGEEVKNP